MGRIKSKKPKGGKKIKEPPAQIPSTQPTHPKFSLRYAVQKGKHGFSGCTTDEKSSIATKINKLSRITWDEIAKSNRHKNGSEKLPRSILPTPPSHITDDVKFTAFRFHGKCPFIGYRDSDTYYIIWFDPNCNLYKH